jgi:hypothetical protein
MGQGLTASTDFLGICIYGLVMMVITVVALVTRGWTKVTIIVLIIAWVPWLLFSAAVLLLLVSVRGILNAVLATLLVSSPLLLIIAVSLAVWYFSNRWRN